VAFVLRYFVVHRVDGLE